MTQRILSQKVYPGKGGGPLDDCWVMAVLQGVHEVMPWANLPSIKAFREAAGEPDSPTGSDGATEVGMWRGLSTIWPDLAAISRRMSGWTWRHFLDDAKVAGPRPAALIVKSALLPDNYGFLGWHAILALHKSADDWFAWNPLAEPHSWPDKIKQSQLRGAVEAYRGNVYGVLFPTEAEALKLHPLYREPGFSKEQLDLAVALAELKGRRNEWDRQVANASVTLAPKP